MKISPEQVLEFGARVRLGNYRGTVTDSHLVDAHNGGKIAVHTLRLTERFKRGFGANGLWATMPKPIRRTVNYICLDLL